MFLLNIPIQFRFGNFKNSRIFSIMIYSDDELKNEFEMQYYEQNKATRPNLSNQTNQIKPTKLNLSNKPTKADLQNKAYKTKHTKQDLSNLLRQTYQTELTNPNIQNLSHKIKAPNFNFKQNLPRPSKSLSSLRLPTA